MPSSSGSSDSSSTQSCTEKFGDTVDNAISSFFFRIGHFVGHRPRWTLLLSIALTVLCGAGFARWETESRGEELWVPQDTEAEQEEEQYLQYFPRTARFEQIIVSASESSSSSNVLSKDLLQRTLQLHLEIETGQAVIEDEGTFDYLDLCAASGGSCASLFPPEGVDSICNCLITSVFKQWNYNMTTLENDADFMATLNSYGTREDLEAVLGGAVFDSTTGQLVSAEALTINYFLQDRAVVENGERTDPINEGWEEQVFLEIAEDASSAQSQLNVDYFASRSFSDEFGSAISGDLTLVQISYAVAFVFLGATLGRIKCGTGSRWTMALAALVMVGLSTAASFGLSSAFGLFYGPVHSLLPFILLGIGVDDAFVIGK